VLTAREAIDLARTQLAPRPDLLDRLNTLVRLAVAVRPSEYHVTNACNIRCDGCWFFVFGHDKQSKEETDLGKLDAFLHDQVRRRRVNAALVIGGEPSLVPRRLEVFRRHFRYLTISTNGLRPLPRDGFEEVAIGVTLFGGGPMDDQLRGIKPGGRRFTGLFDTALANYRNDDRAGFIYAVTEDGVAYVEDTVRRIQDNGNRLQFNYYSSYGAADGALPAATARLLDELLRVRDRYPETVVSHPYYIETLLTGQSHFARFGYEVCPSISADHPAHQPRIESGAPNLPLFNSYAADLETLNFCCTSGHCADCRDSQAVLSWLLVSMREFLASVDALETWIEVAESYWRQFIWGPLHWTKQPPAWRAGAAPPAALRVG